MITSDLQRAKETAEILAEALGLEGVLDEPMLREIDVGRWSGLSREEIEARDPDAYAAWREGRLQAFPDGEGRETFAARVMQGLERAVEKGADLIVAHGGVLRAIERHCGLERGPSFGHLDGLRLGIEGEVRVLERVRLLG